MMEFEELNREMHLRFSWAVGVRVFLCSRSLVCQTQTLRQTPYTWKSCRGQIQPSPTSTETSRTIDQPSRATWCQRTLFLWNHSVKPCGKWPIPCVAKVQRGT